MPAARFRPAERPAANSPRAEEPVQGVLAILGHRPGSRLLAFVLVAVLAVLVLVGLRANALWGSYRAAGETERLAGLTVQATELAHELQQERDHTLGFLRSGKKANGDLVALQHVDVGNALEDYRAARLAVAAPSGSAVSDRLATADAELVKLTQLRAAADSEKPDVTAVTAGYSRAIGALVAILPVIGESSSDPGVVGSARALGAIAAAKEIASQQRGYLFGILTVDRFAKGEAGQLTVQKGKLQAALDTLRGSLDEENLAAYDATVDTEAVKSSDALVDNVLAVSGGKEFGVGAAQWFDTVSTRIDLMRAAEAQLAANVIDDSSSVTSGAFWRLLIEGVLLGVVLLGTAGLAGLVALLRRRGTGGSSGSLSMVRRRIFTLAGIRSDNDGSNGAGGLPSGSGSSAAGLGGPGDRPVDLKDVVRAAAGQIDDQARVVQGTMTPRAVTAAVLTDVVHIITELLDNAARFSDPETRVFVKAKSAVDGGAVVEVEDQGNGMVPGDLAAANALLAGNVNEGSAGGGLGLLVVGRLAARHGIAVQLRPSEDDHGLTAVVRLPAAVVVLSTASRGDGIGPREAPAPRETPGRGAAATSATLREGPATRESSALPRREPGAARPDLSPFGAAATTGETTQIWDFQSKPREVPDLPWSTAAQPAVTPPTPSSGLPSSPLSSSGGEATNPWSAGMGTPGRLPRRPPSTPGAAADDVNEPHGLASAQAWGETASRADTDSSLDPVRPAAGHWPADIWNSPALADDLAAESGVGRRLPSERFDMPGPADVTLPDISRIVPPITEPALTDTDVRLSIFDAIESEWFRQRAIGDYPHEELSDSWEQPAVEWSSPADEGWRAAERLNEAQAVPVTSKGLPQRVPMANFVPGSIAPTDGPAQRPAHPRSAEMVREMLSTYHRGVREGRHARHRR